jgi:dUTP pyrophosphatase
LGYRWQVWKDGKRVLAPNGQGGFDVCEEAEAYAESIGGIVVDMFVPQVKFTLEPGAKLPEYAHSTDSGADLFSVEEHFISAGETQMVDTGLKIELPEGYEAQVRSKSGLACKHSVHVLNSPGTVDCGYRGPVKVILHNAGKETFHVKPGDKIAQLVIAPYIQGKFHAVSALSDTDRGENGFGSTGRQ